MAESSGDRTEDPTPERLRKAREEGQVAQSRDLTAAIAALVGIGLLWSQSEELVRVTRQAATDCFRAAVSPDLDLPLALTVAGGATFRMLIPTLVPLVAIVAGAALTSFLQAGPMFASGAITPKLERLDPIGGLRQRFASTRAYVELGKNLLKYGVGIPVFYIGFRDAIPSMVWLATREPLVAAQWAAPFLVHMTFNLLACFLSLALLDLLYQRWQLMKDLRMTKQEVKDSFKDSEGDPSHKAKRRQMHEEISVSQMLVAVPEADVVITNPDHYAVALRWDPEREGAPRIVAKGADHVAHRIKEVAKANGIPIDRRASLARTLHALSLNSEIPPDLYAAVITVLEWAEAEAALVGRTPNWVKAEPDDPSSD